MAKKTPGAKIAAPGTIDIDIGIGAKDRAAIADGLSYLVADTCTLYLTMHDFHGKGRGCGRPTRGNATRRS
jgi:starvation-inducible DNA-binding protein